MRTSVQFQCFGKHAAGLLYVTNSLSGRKFLCNTGAKVSVLPASEVDVCQAKGGPALEAANGSAIPTFGTRTVALCFSDQRFTWEFVLAKVSTPLLGADFLCVNGLLVGCGEPPAYQH